MVIVNRVVSAVSIGLEVFAKSTNRFDLALK